LTAVFTESSVDCASLILQNEMQIKNKIYFI
jgi:hypothetical protein